MKVSRDRKTILVENPLTGNTSVSNALNLSDGEKIGKWATPLEIRERVGEKAWRAAQKIVLVRDPIARLISGATLALNLSTEGLQSFGASEEFSNDVSALAAKEARPQKLLGRFLEILKGYCEKKGGDIPVFLLPQSGWLKAKMDLVLATHNIAEFFNQEGTRCCLRVNMLHRNPALPVQVARSPDSDAATLDLYREDVRMFERLLVWSPIKGKVRLVSGYCATCEARKAADSFEPIDLTKEWADKDRDGQVTKGSEEQIKTKPKATSRQRRSRKA